MDLKKFRIGIARLAKEKNIPEQKVLEIVETAMASAYKKDYGKKGQKIIAKLDFNSNKLLFWQVKQVVDKNMILSEEELSELAEKESGQEIEGDRKIRFSPERHIMIEDAKEIEPEIKVDEDLKILLETHEDYGRIAAQTAKQVLLQKMKESERELVFEEYKKKENEIISGTVQRVGARDIFFDIGKVLGILKKEEQIPGEFYKIGQRFKLYVLKVENTVKGPMIFLSRAFPKFISKLFELEVPEIAGGEVEIVSIAREPGSRTKIAVKSNSEEIDPIGSAVGQRGARVSAVINELGGEKIDIIKYSDQPEVFIGNALSPTKVLEVQTKERNQAVCIVPEDQLSLAIGKDGQNVRLAAKLTGWKIDVRSSEEIEQEKKSELKQEKKQEKPKEKKEKKEKKVEKVKKPRKKKKE